MSQFFFYFVVCDDFAYFFFRKKFIISGLWFGGTDASVSFIHANRGDGISTGFEEIEKKRKKLG